MEGVELSSRGGWLSFALIWTWAGGWGAAGREAGRQGRGWAGWRRGNLPSTTTMAALLFILPSYSLIHIPAQGSTVLLC